MNVIEYMKNLIFKLLVLLLSFGLIVSAAHADVDEDASSFEDVTTFSPAAVSVDDHVTGGDQNAEYQNETPSEGAPADGIMDQLVGTITAEAPQDTYTTVMANVAENYGIRTDTDAAVFNPDAINLDFDRQELGYTRGGMDGTLQGSIVANNLVDRLFSKYASFRDVKGLVLPAEFSVLVRFVEGYIKANAPKDAESVNGMNHHNLAIQVLRASFCFGNDPFMIASKMRRETGFRRASISPTGAVGFSQMTGDGIAEVRDQMAVGGQRIVNRRARTVSMPNARGEFLQAIRCFSGLEQNQWTFPSGTNEQIKARLRNSWAWDMIFGQTMIKAIVSWAMAGGQFANTAQGKILAYRETFARYNGDDNPTTPICMRAEVIAKQTPAQRKTGLVPSVPMRDEYACDSIQHFQRMSDQWNVFVRKNSGQQRRIVVEPGRLGDFG